MNTKNEKNTPVLGRDIPWKDIEKEAFRAINFTPMGVIEKGKIKTISINVPYAFLTVESPKLKQESTIWVVHKVDFTILWKAYKERGINPNEEVIVFCPPYTKKSIFKVFSGLLPRLWIYIYPSGHLEGIYDNKIKPGEWFEPLAEFTPDNYR